EAAGALLDVREVAVPVGLVGVRAVRARDDRGQPGGRAPDDAIARRLGVEAEIRVLVMERVVVAAREERPHRERAARAVDEPPVEHDRRATGLDEHAMLDAAAVRQPEYPRGPRVGNERLDA